MPTSGLPLFPPSMSSGFEKTLNIALVIAAVAVAALVAKRELWPSAKVSAQPAAAGPRFVDDWRKMQAAAHTLGSRSAPVSIIEFVDMQCPYCARFHQTLSKVLEARGGAVSYSFVHLPLPGHPHALSAARAVECARIQQRFSRFLDVAFAKQDSIGRKTWPSFAAEAGVADTISFGRCARDTSAVPMIQAGIALAEEHNVRATPTFVLNGWLYSGAPTESQLDRAIDRLLQGKDPR